MTDETKNGEPVLPFTDARAFAKWLRAHHAKSKGLWLKLAKKGSGVKSVTYAEAVDEALCWGWIDAVKGKHDDTWWLQRFTPRGPRSLWSKVNREKVAVLISAGRMQPTGLAAIERAKQNGQWAQAYDSPKNAKPPADLLAALAARPGALAFFEGLTGANRYAILIRLQTAKKPETRARRLAVFVEQCAKGETVH
jgi:uncharacterized protein YdeI (YjbR/CyaY-like superfamily)